MINCKTKFNLEKGNTNNTFLYEMVYLAEKTSEHPIAESICSQIALNIPNKIDTLKDRYNVKSFKNRNGEGIIA